ncbi:MAG: glucose-6-phosphate isomerase [Desulfarculales bacterium]|nr:glucose-6-phosphate isomerase [Desulfarculales bacterium]
MADKSIILDYSCCLAEIIGGNGLNREQVDRLEKEMVAVHEKLAQMRADDILGFWNLPWQDGLETAKINNLVSKWRDKIDNLVVLGIGGSALGTTAVDMALHGVWRLALPATGQRPLKIWVADNSDPRNFYSLLNRLDQDRTLYNVVSKSGSTAETMSQFLIVSERLNKKLGREKAQSRIIFTTDPQEGALRYLAEREGYAALDLPSNVGGRYSVLSSVGLFPLAMAGHDINALLEGARAMAERCAVPEFAKNPAYIFAAMAISAWRAQRNVLVMMPYVSDLFGLAQWFVQLWAESLGKRFNLAGEDVFVGQTAVAATGATDQHSQLQLFMEGPQDKLLCFLSLDNYGRDLEIPCLYDDMPAFSYLGGRSMSELIQSEARATASALALEGRPSLSIRLPSITEHILGQLLFMLQAATVAAGAMLNINPLDQPGVELSKKLTYGLMGRSGYEEFKAKLLKQATPYIV